MGISLGSLVRAGGTAEEAKNNWKIAAEAEANRRGLLGQEFSLRKMQEEAQAKREDAEAEYYRSRNQTAEDVANTRGGTQLQIALAKLAELKEASDVRDRTQRAAIENHFAIAQLADKTKRDIAAIRMGTQGQKVAGMTARLHAVQARAKEIASQYQTPSDLAAAEKANPQLTAELDAPVALDPQNPNLRISLRGEVGSAWQGQLNTDVGHAAQFGGRFGSGPFGVTQVGAAKHALGQPTGPTAVAPGAPTTPPTRPSVPAVPGSPVVSSAGLDPARRQQYQADSLDLMSGHAAAIKSGMPPERANQLLRQHMGVLDSQYGIAPPASTPLSASPPEPVPPTSALPESMIRPLPGIPGLQRPDGQAADLGELAGQPA